MAEPRRSRRLLRPGLGRRARIAAELDEELETHVQLCIDDLVRRGRSPGEARAEALAGFGDFSRARSGLRSGALRRDAALTRRDLLGSLRDDLRFAFRQARRAPALTALGVVTLGVAIGLATTTFTLVDHILLQPLSFPQPERLVELESMDSTGGHFPRVSTAGWLDWHDAPVLDASAILQQLQFNIVSTDGAMYVPGAVVSADYVRVLHPRFLLGRSFSADEAEAGAAVAVVSEALWRNMLGGDSTLSTRVHGADRELAVVGVIASGDEYPPGTDLWIPVPFDRASNPSRNNVNYEAIGRLAPGTTFAAAQRELSRIASNARAEDPGALYSYGVHVGGLRETIVSESRSYLTLLMGAVALLLLIAAPTCRRPIWAAGSPGRANWRCAPPLAPIAPDSSGSWWWSTSPSRPWPVRWER